MNFLDKAIQAISPKWGAHRAAYRGLIDAQHDLQSSYSGAVQTRYESGWNVSQQPSALWNTQNWELDAMRDRARNLERNNDLAKGILDRCADNIVGTGFKFQADSADPEWNKQCDELMYGWFPYADITGASWESHQYLVCRSWLRDGDIGSVLIANGQIQPVEGDLIRTPTDADNSDDSIVHGVRLGTANRATGYSIKTVLPDGTTDYETIDAQDFAFLMMRTQLSQIRGVTNFATTFDTFDQLAKWKRAQLAAAQAAACLSIFIKKQNPANALGNLGTTTNGSGQQQRVVSLEPGMIGYLQPNEEIQTVNPTQPAQSFPDNFAAMIRVLGAAWGLPLELAILDFSRTSYNSARASLEQAYRHFRVLQQQFRTDYLSKIARWRISKFIKDGKLKARPDAWKHNWIAMPWAYLDVLKEIQGQMLEIDCGLDTLSDALQERGTTLERYIQRRQEELEKLKVANVPQVHHSMSVPYPAPGETPSITASGQTTPEAEDEGERNAA